jgi:hypothetical protein
MYLLDAMDELAAHPNDPRTTYDYELRTRVHLTGNLDLGAIRVQHWELLDRTDSTDPRSIHLRTASPAELRDPGLQPAPPRDDQYYFPEGLPAEVCALLTVFSRAHFVPVRSVTFRGTPLMRRFPGSIEVARTPVDGSTFALGDLEQLFRQLTGLREKQRNTGARRLEPFMLACRLYHLALALRHTDPSIGYITLVSAVETLSHDAPIPMPTLGELNPDLARLVRERFPDGFSAVERAVLGQNRHIKKRFIAFTLAHLPESYWADPTRPTEEWARFRDPDHLTTYLSRIYNARSSALHDGVPFPPTASFLNNQEEVPIAGGMQIGNRHWQARELLPPFRAFERIVHHVLTEYLRRESEPAPAPAALNET